MNRNFKSWCASLILIINFIGCKRLSNSDHDMQLELHDVKKETYLDLYFPDTLMVNEPYNGEIVYHGALDSITKTLLLEGDSIRIISFYVKDNKEYIDYKMDHILGNNSIKIFVPDNDMKIKFNYTFEKTGSQYLEGVVEDELYLKTSDTTDARVIVNYSHVILPVFVTDNPNIIDSYFREEKSIVPIRI